MGQMSDGNPQPHPDDEFSRALTDFGLHVLELRRLEETARMFEQMEWRLARESATGESK